MASAWEALYLSLLYVGWPGFAIVSAYSVWHAAQFYRRLRHSAPGLLVLMTVVGWILTLAGGAFIMTAFLGRAPESAGPAVLPFFVLWAGSLVTVAWVVYRWGEESQVLDTYYGELEKMERMKSGFINHVAHELNTPMTPLRMQVEVLKREALGPLNEKQKMAMVRIDRNLDRLGALVEQVLTASALQSGRLQVEPRGQDICALVRRVAKAVPGVEPDGEGVIMADVDPERLGYALQTLAAHVAAGGRDAPVRIGVADEGTSVTVTIRHGGTSLTQKDFEMFGDPAIAAQRDGLAIGLFNVHGIVARHGGRIEASPGVVVVRLPIRQVATRTASRRSLVA